MATNRWGKGAFASLWLAFAACSPQAAEQAPSPALAAPATHPVSGLETIPVTIDTGERTHVFRAEVARTQQEQSRGLMFRTELAPDEGMLFTFGEARMLGFWMRNTVLPLDMIFIGADHRIINIAADTVPYSEATVQSERPGIAVLELNAGRAAELGIEPGDLVDW